MPYKPTVEQSLDRAQIAVEEAMRNLPERLNDKEYENLVVAARLLAGTIDVFMSKLKDHHYSVK
jgi:hypothetical protein